MQEQEVSQRPWVHVHLGKKTDEKKSSAPHSKAVVIGKRLSDLLQQGSVKHVSHPVITLTDSVREFKPMPVYPCGLVNLLGEEGSSDRCWKCNLLISTWLPHPFTPI